MDARDHMTFGFPRMHTEAGERRDFLPSLMGKLTRLGVEVFVESGIGSGMGFEDADYASVSPRVQIVDHDAALAQDIVVVLRAPDDDLSKMRSGSTLISMLHYSTRPSRVQRLRDLGLRAISLDAIVDDRGFRLVEDARAVAWNGLKVAFDVLEESYPQLVDRHRPPIEVTVMGAGSIGKHAVEAATKYGDLARDARYRRLGLPGVQVVTIGRNLTPDSRHMQQRMRTSDVLVDATKRHDASHPVVPNAWIALLPMHAVICDLVVDPYDESRDRRTVRGIEGIPQGNLDRYILPPADPAWHETVPAGVPTRQRRTVVSCYSWPGIHPRPGMEAYEMQLWPLLEVLVERGGVQGLRPDGSYHERALCRATLPGGEQEIPVPRDASGERTSLLTG